MDVVLATRIGGCTEILFADDLSIFKDFDRAEDDGVIMFQMEIPIHMFTNGAGGIV